MGASAGAAAPSGDWEQAGCQGEEGHGCPGKELQAPLHTKMQAAHSPWG